MSTLWISHRGLKGGAVENTREAFRQAVEHGFTALETDLRLSRDGHLVLHHDPDLGRLAGIHKNIADMTRQELARVPLAGGGRLFFLDEFIREFPGCSWTFDIKEETGEGVLRALHAWAQGQGLLDWLMAQGKFLTWHQRHEALLLELFPRAVCYARELECWRAGLGMLAKVPGLAGLRPGRTYSLPARVGPIPLFTPALVEAFHRRGAKVLAFLPANEDEARQAVEAGFDEILTDGPMVPPRGVRPSPS